MRSLKSLGTGAFAVPVRIRHRALALIMPDTLKSRNTRETRDRVEGRGEGYRPGDSNLAWQALPCARLRIAAVATSPLRPTTTGWGGARRCRATRRAHQRVAMPVMADAPMMIGASAVPVGNSPIPQQARRPFSSPKPRTFRLVRLMGRNAFREAHANATTPQTCACVASLRRLAPPPLAPERRLLCHMAS